MMDIFNAFKTAEILKHSSPSSLASLAKASYLKEMKKGQHLFRDKEKVESVYTVISGMTALYKISGTGEKKVLLLCGKGQTANEHVLFQPGESASCEVLKSGLVLCISRKELLEIMADDFCLARGVMESSGKKVRKMYRQLANSGTTVRGDKRIAAKLWKMANDYGVACEEGILVDIGISITYLADIVGARRETVSRQVKTLSDLGLIKVYNSKFLIPDSEKLAEYFKTT